MMLKKVNTLRFCFTICPQKCCMLLLIAPSVAYSSQSAYQSLYLFGLRLCFHLPFLPIIKEVSPYVTLHLLFKDLYIKKVK